jgi:DNA-binding IclR family transcriptional regulator
MRQIAQTDTLVQSVNRALDILDFLIETSGGAPLSRICEGTGLNISTVHRLLATLIAHGYVRQDSGTKEYHLGPQSLRLAQSALGHFDIRSHAMDALRRLASEARELSNLAVLSGDHVIYIAQVPAEERSIQMFTQLGARVPLHCSGVGKAILAHLSETSVERLIGGRSLAAFTVKTITNSLALKNELEQIRLRGYAIDDEEREEGVRCLAAPVFQSSGEVIAAVSISGPSGRLPLEQLPKLGLMVRETALEVSRNMGYRVS